MGRVGIVEWGRLLVLRGESRAADQSVFGRGGESIGAWLSNCFCPLLHGPQEPDVESASRCPTF